jgi:hypothetical protein
MLIGEVARQQLAIEWSNGDGRRRPVRIVSRRISPGQLSGSDRIVASSVLLALAAMIATWLPARRATRVSPLSTLRTD